MHIKTLPAYRERFWLFILLFFGGFSVFSLYRHSKKYQNTSCGGKNKNAYKHSPSALKEASKKI
ncbi:MAG TPA: hypothetical protein DD733_10355 [Clostridiales bacterium]|nr:hypothetical protein [Clostridiales bacterium]